MRTIYLGDRFNHNADKRRLSSREVDYTPRGDDIPVFDRYASGGRDDYARPWREDDAILKRRLKPWETLG